MTKPQAILFCLSLAMGFASQSAFAFKNKTFSAGIGYYSQNFLNKVTQKDDGSGSFLGETNYPINFKYDYGFLSDWFLAPQLSHTFFPRQDPGNSSTVTITHLIFQFGKNLGASRGQGFDWYVGPGLINYEIAGAGGTTRLNNGTTTSTFAVPGRKSTVRKITACAGGSVSFDNSRFGLDLVFENVMSSSKRSQSFMLSYGYQFGGSF